MQGLADSVRGVMQQEQVQLHQAFRDRHRYLMKVLTAKTLKISGHFALLTRPFPSDGADTAGQGHARDMTSTLMSPAATIQPNPAAVWTDAAPQHTTHPLQEHLYCK